MWAKGRWRRCASAPRLLRRWKARDTGCDFAQVETAGHPDRRRDRCSGERALPTSARKKRWSRQHEFEARSAGIHKNFDVDYPADYPDPKLAGKKYHYASNAGIKQRNCLS